jgi:uncharacterized protein YqhQ
MTDNSEPLTVGGQAVIEGVMMRSPWRIATAVRRKKGEIVVDSYPFISLTKRKKTWGLPILRGAVSLFEALYLGIKTLNWSAEIAVQDEMGEDKKSQGWKDKVLATLSILFALIAGLGLFMYLPYWISGLIKDAGGSQFIFHLVAGIIRITIFLLYLYLISMWSEIRRIFQYHGAEHKSIFAYESTGEAEVQTAFQHSRFHPRCGTSFLLITAVVIILLFAVIDSIIVPLFGAYRNPFQRLLWHLPLIPLVAGTAYEVLKLSSKKRENRFWQSVIKPGLWLQHITTQEPDDKQLEVAITALKASLQGRENG